jgi:DNA ligase-1
MKLRDLARGFAELERIRGRLRAIRIIADLLDRAGPSEREAIVYLLQGRLRPPYEAVEFGVGERLLVRVLGRASDRTEAAITRRYKQLGDLGLVAEELAPGARIGWLTVRKAYQELLGVARAAGSGAVERKIGRLVTLLGKASAQEARYLVRIVQGRLRLGVGDATILEAAAAGALGDRGKKQLVEQAYNVRSDLGGVVKLAYARGARGLARVGPAPGVPVRPALAQRLPSAEAIITRLGEVRVEPKYDGFRLQLHRDGDRVWAFSRRLEDVSVMFPEVTAAVRKQLKARRAIIEGEAVSYDLRTGRFLPFQITMTRKRKHRVAEAARRHPIRLFAFDLLSLNGKNYLPESQEKRSGRLSRLLRRSQRATIAATESLTTSRPEEIQRYFDRMLSRGLEGIVAKRPDAPYRAGARGFDWVKLKRSYQTKLRDTVDLVLISREGASGRRSEWGRSSPQPTIRATTGSGRWRRSGRASPKKHGSHSAAAWIGWPLPGVPSAWNRRSCRMSGSSPAWWRRCWRMRSPARRFIPAGRPAAPRGMHSGFPGC